MAASPYSTAATSRPLQRARRSDRPAADHSKRDTVLAAVKAWPVGCGVRSTGGATAILDRGCVRRHCAPQVGTWRNRGTGTVLVPNNANGARPCLNRLSINMLVSMCP
jgi:hypothetical protein